MKIYCQPVVSFRAVYRVAWRFVQGVAWFYSSALDVKSFDVFHCQTRPCISIASSIHLRINSLFFLWCFSWNKSRINLRMFGRKFSLNRFFKLYFYCGQTIYLFQKWNKKWGSPASFQRKGVWKTSLILINWGAQFSLNYRFFKLK